MQMFLWGLDKDLAKKVALAHPKSLQSAISIAEDLELAVRFAHRPVVKGRCRSIIFRSGHPGQSRGPTNDAMAWSTPGSWMMGKRWWPSGPMAGCRGADLEGTAVFPHRDRTSRIGGDMRLSFEDEFRGLSIGDGEK